MSAKGETLIAMAYMLAFTVASRLITIQRHRNAEAKEAAKKNDASEQETNHLMRPLI